MLQDFRLALRSSLKRPGFTVVILLTLALGIGATTAIYSVVRHVLLRPLPYPEPERLVEIWTSMPSAGIPQLSLAHGEYADFRRETELFTEVGAWWTVPVVLTGNGDPRRLLATTATASLWPVLGIEAELGRTFTEEQERAREPVVVLSHGLWQRHFGGENGVLGRSVSVDGVPRTVVGVMPAGFRFPSSDVEMWVPIRLDEARRNNHHLSVLGRLRPEAAPGRASMERMQAEMDAFVAGWAERYDHAHPLFPLIYGEQLLGGVRAPLNLLFAAVGFVLLIACFNVAGLLVARGEGRRQEMAMRATLGAGRLRLVRQMVTESLVLGLGGGGLGTVLAIVGLKAILALEPGSLPRLEEVTLDLPVLVFAIAVSLLSGVVFGLVPAWRTARPDLTKALHGASRATADGLRQLLRGSLVVVEIAVAVTLVTGAALLVRSFWNLLQVDPGLEPDHVLAARVSLPETSFPEGHDVSAFYDEISDRLATLPGARSASVVNSLPMRDRIRLVLVSGPWQPPGEDPVAVDVVMVGADYFATVGTPVLRGRSFTAADREDAPRVAAVNETMARMLFGGASPQADPLGRQLTIQQARPPEPTWEVVAVIRDVPTFGLGQDIRPQLFLPMPQAISMIRGVTRSASLVMKTEADPISLAGALRSEVWRIDQDLAVSDLQTMESVVSESLAPQRFVVSLLALFSALALVLAAVGIYGLLAHLVGLRRREIGIRLALGARREQVLRRILRHGLRLAGGGVAIGLIAASAAGRLLDSQLYGVESRDPWSLLATAILLVTVAALASYLPARRAAAVDPAHALREE